MTTTNQKAEKVNLSFYLFFHFKPNILLLFFFLDKTVFNDNEGHDFEEQVKKKALFYKN